MPEPGRRAGRDTTLRWTAKSTQPAPVCNSERKKGGFGGAGGGWGCAGGGVATCGGCCRCHGVRSAEAQADPWAICWSSREYHPSPPGETSPAWREPLFSGTGPWPPQGAGLGLRWPHEAPGERKGRLSVDAWLAGNPLWAHCIQSGSSFGSTVDGRSEKLYCWLSPSEHVLHSFCAV
jgi:hypothetical protein